MEYNFKYKKNRTAMNIFKVCALIAVISLLLIIIFVFYNGLTPFFTGQYSFFKFIFGVRWLPSENEFGVLPMIQATVYGTLGALVIGIPIGIFTAVLISEILPEPMSKVMTGVVQLLAGIPSVLYGVFALGVIVPAVQTVFGLSQGQGLVSVIIVLAIMMLPTIISVSGVALRNVPKQYKEAALGLGASRTETIFKVVIPAAKTGLITGVGLGMGRAIGETMAVILVAGNSPIIIDSIDQGVRPLTTNIALEMGYAVGLHELMLYSTGVVLFAFILILNLVLARISSKDGR